ncbi:SGNH/GDSL hydrolase family protein [Hyalangium rubrum]|uniref:SGNH/GDSL hydrolase family protein n=1 Tax=Hyalangium rubrum TaxID=3103134 RepID=A0ABU5HB35_9BACT|nr:SGNH/GDSL hydrolase family protein [Hyalangium sp. s54d21]MDY7230038.1 SGNH/GDSL hydrolase family protein [Hyalangium sp. s54d21]
MTPSLSRQRFTWSTLLALLAASLLTACFGRATHDDAAASWYGTWSVAPQDYNEPFPTPLPPLVFSNQTIRQVLRTSAGGKEVRVRFSNVFGKAPLKIDGASIARAQSGASIAPASSTELKFNGQPSVSIPAGEELWSDPAALAVEAETDLAVSLFLASDTPASTQHMFALRDNYVAAGNALATDTLSNPETRTSYFFITGVDVRSSARASVVVAFGDSITDGVGSTPGSNRRWTDFLVRRLRAEGNIGTVSVLNAGISGGRILTDVMGPKGVDRFERDVLGQSGVSHVIILLGINDIGFASFVPNQEVSVEQMTAGLQSMIDKAKARGVKVLVGTLLPYKGAAVAGTSYYQEAHEPKRQAFNAWIRENKTLDGVIDFADIMKNPADPLAILPAYDSGDRLHPSDAGYEAMARAIDLALITSKP